MTITETRARVAWALWLSMLALTTAALLAVRADIEQSHAALALLLVVLGGSAGGGRVLGYVLAVAAFILIDYFFQAPYGFLSVGKALDWVVLAAFLASAFVATELLSRAREEAATARSRTDEVILLSRLGSETLRYADAGDALTAVSGLIRATLGARWCTIRQLPDSLGVVEWTSAMPDLDETARERMRVVDNRIAAASKTTRVASNHLGVAAIADRVIIDSLDALETRLDIEVLGIPLFIEARLVGVLIIGGDSSSPIMLDDARQRFIATISYYAALGAERVRLATEAGHARELREANRAKDEVLATVSHDLRTPLTTIKLLAHGAAERGDPAGVLIVEQSDRLANLVTNVLDLSRIRSGGVTLDLALNTAEDVVAAAISRAEGVLRGRHIVTHVDLNQPAFVAHFDFVETLRILGNLIDNALRYSPEGGTVEVTTLREGASLAINVADRGPGVAPAEQDRIFEAFYRPRSEAPDAGRAGLGLSIARRLAELQGGSVEYRPREGGGSVFSLRLPAFDLTPATLADLAMVEADDDAPGQRSTSKTSTPTAALSE